jgi:ABC-2 type transport system ATP-binding protein
MKGWFQMIELTSVSKKIKQKTILDDINLIFNEGNAYLLEGPNGSGKTMLLRVICGLLLPSAGTVKYDTAHSFGVIIETPSFIKHETGLYNLKYLASINKKAGSEKILDTMRKLNLYEFRNDKVKTYSLGMKQRLGISQALMEDQDVLLFDEPFNALDDENYAVVMKIMDDHKKNGGIIVVAAHGLEENRRELFDTTIRVDAGKVYY